MLRIAVALSLLLVGCAGASTRPGLRPGTEGSLRVTPGYTATWLAIDKGTYLILERAARDRDDRPYQWALSSGGVLDVRDGTRLRIVARDGDMLHVDILDGEHAGRRGYLAASYFKP